MKPLQRWSAVLLFVLPTWSAATPPAFPKFPPLEFHPPRPARFVEPNGLTIFLLEDHELPLIKIETITRAGSQYDPADKVGLGEVFGEAMTRGGSARFTPEQIDRLLDTTAANIDFSVALENASGSMSCRTQDFDRVFSAFADMLMHPQFRDDEFEIAKGKLSEGLRRLNDSPEEMARREFRRLIYGTDHPYARTPSPMTVQQIHRSDLIAMHQIYFHPNTTWIAVSGDFSAEAMHRKIQEAFGAWPSSNVTLPIIPAPKATASQQIFYIQRSIDQSQIRMGMLGLERHNPDHFAWEVLNELWGGSATSVLFRTVRTQQGLAYSVNSAFWEPAQKGLILALSQTRSAETIAATQSILKISQDVAHAPFTGTEVKTAKEAIINRFIDNYSSSAQIVDDVMSFEYFGFPADYIDTYTQHIQSVSEADLKRVGQLYIHPDQFKILIVGDAGAFGQPLTALGDVHPWQPLDYSQTAPK